MTTLKQYAREMIRREFRLGWVYALSGLAAQTATVGALATGSISANKFKKMWMTRRETGTAADRVRICSDFNTASGILTHAGTAYGDTTATSEFLELTEHNPYWIDQAIQMALKMIRHLDTSILPVRNVDRYWLTDLSWIKEPSDIRRIYTRSNPVISRNQWFDQWNTVTTTGLLTPDHWVVGGATAPWARGTGVDRSQYSVNLTRSGVTVTITQTIDLLLSGVDADSLRGQVVTGFLVGQSEEASSLRVRVLDGVSSDTNSSYHTGNSRTQELTAQKTLDGSSTTLQVQARVEVDETAIIARLGLCIGPITDAVRRDIALNKYPIQRPKFETNGPIQLQIPRDGLGHQLVVESYRPYPGFDQDRITSGSADIDVSDAPLELVAECALYLLYGGIGDGPAVQSVARKHEENYVEMAGSHLYIDNDEEGGLPLPFADRLTSVRRI